MNSEILRIQILGEKNASNMTNLKLRENSVTQIFKSHAFFFFLLPGATWYCHAIYIVFTNFASFTGYENDIYEVFLIFTFKDPNLAENLTNLAENLFLNWTPRSSLSFKSAYLWAWKVGGCQRCEFYQVTLGGVPRWWQTHPMQLHH